MSTSARPKRQRYIGFTVEVASGETPPRASVVEAIDAACDAAGLSRRRRLTVFDGRVGILKGTAHEKDALLGALRGITRIGGVQASVETIVSSGTIKKVKGLLGIGRSP